MEARPEYLLTHAEVVSLLDLRVEEDGSAVHGFQDGTDSIPILIGGNGRDGRNGTNPMSFICFRNGVRLRLGNERL